MSNKITLSIKQILVFLILTGLFWISIGFVIGQQSSQSYKDNKMLNQFLKETFADWKFYYQEWKNEKE